MTVKPPGRNDPCRCRSGKKFKKCCFLKKPRVAGLEPAPLVTPSSRTPKPTFWQHPPGKPNAPPPAGAEWTDYFFVKDKGWTHERDLKPGDQYRLKGGSWDTVKPDQVIETTDEHPFFVKGKGWTPANEIRPGDEVRTEDGWIPIKSSESTGRFEPVYNFRIADFHTYFVGCDEWGFAVWAHNAGFNYGGLDLEAIAGEHFPEGRTKGRLNLNPDSPGEIVRVKAPGADLDLSLTSSQNDGKSYAIYAFVNKLTRQIDYIGRAKTPADVSDTSILKAIRERLRGHKRDGTFDPETQAVIALDAQESYPSYRGAEQFFNDLYEGRGSGPKGNTYQPLDSVDSRTRQKSVGYLTRFYEERLGIQNPPITTEIDSRIAQQGGR